MSLIDPSKIWYSTNVTDVTQVVAFGYFRAKFQEDKTLKEIHAFLANTSNLTKEISIQLFSNHYLFFDH